MMAADERSADFYGSDLDGEVVESDDESAQGGAGEDGDGGGWESELSDADLGMLEAIHHTLTHHAHRHRLHGPIHARIVGRDDAVAAAEAAAADDVGDDDVEEEDEEVGGSSSEDESQSDSGDEPDMFGADFPNTLEITMETIDDGSGAGAGGRAALERAAGLSALLMETMEAGVAAERAGMAAARRLNGLGRLGRPLGGLNGGNPLLLDFSAGAGAAQGRGGGGLGWAARLGGGGGGAHGPSMLHPLVDGRGDASGGGGAIGQQARAERVARSSLSGPLRAAPDDVFGLGAALASQLSHAHSRGRRPAHAHHVIPGASSQREPRAWLDGSGGSAVAVEYGAAHEVLAQLVRLCQAAAAADAFAPMGTAERWQEEARMQPRAPASAYTTRIGAPILNRLAPEAIRQNLLRQRYQVERRRRLAEVDRQRVERESSERREREAEAAAEAEREAAAKAEAEAEAEAAQHEQGAEDMALDHEEDQVGEAVKETETAEEAEAEAVEEAPAEPVFVVVNGERVDITDTGIDLEFLLALPDDLRMEVIEGRREEQRQAAAAAAASSSLSAGGGGGADQTRDGAAGQQQQQQAGISQEFLDALPPEIRAEVLEQERIQRQLLDRDEMLRHMERTTT
ncbi:E3 ubiquitin-protein ligase tom1, partial [Coemansia sp. RSA 2424]